MSRLWIVDGDTTDHGGTVSVPHARITVSGRNVAAVGDKVSCPKCNVVATIIQGNARADMNGAGIAEVGGLTSCGARLISIKQNFVNFGEGTDHRASDALQDSGSTETPEEEICETCLEEAITRHKGIVERA